MAYQPPRSTTCVTTPNPTGGLDRLHPCSTRTAHNGCSTGRLRIYSGRVGKSPSTNRHPHGRCDALNGGLIAPWRGGSSRCATPVLDRLDRPSRAQGVLHPHTGSPLTAPSARGRHGCMETTPATHPSPPPTFGLAEAATACGVHVDTLRRALRKGAIPGAARATRPNGAWQLPHDGLVAAGFNPMAGQATAPTLREALEALSAAVALVAGALEVQS